MTMQFDSSSVGGALVSCIRSTFLRLFKASTVSSAVWISSPTFDVEKVGLFLLCQHSLDQVSMNVGEAEVAALETVGEALVIDA
jgi:hypothetical protein